MKTEIFILSKRYGTELGTPEVFLTEEKANQSADEIMKDIIEESYETHTGKTNSLSFKDLLCWAESNGYGDSRYFYDEYDNAAELIITKHEI